MNIKEHITFRAECLSETNGFILKDPVDLHLHLLCVYSQ